MGKTSLALNIALNVARSAEKTVAAFSLAMSKEQLTARLLSMEALVQKRPLKTGTLSEQDWEKIAAATVTLRWMNILIDDDPLLSVSDINAKCRRMDNLALAVIDYLQLMGADGNGRRGETGKTTLRWTPEHMTFSAMENRDEH